MLEAERSRFRNHELETTLSECQQRLLEIRRLNKKGDYEGAGKILAICKALPKTENLSGDIAFLEGAIAHRKGDLKLATQKMEDASTLYRSGGVEHRRLRALINAEICKRDLMTYQSGAMHALGQAAAREKFYDLAGNIARGHAIELLTHGKFPEAFPQAMKSLEYYQLDGCPEDQAVAFTVAAIAAFLLGDLEKARE